MKKYSNIGLVVFSIVFILNTACQKDIVLPERLTLEGSYEGIYRVIVGYQSQNAETTQSTIEMLFSEESYFFNSDNDPDAFCDPRGDYVLSANNIELTETNKNCTQIAKERDNPRGQFAIRRPPPDSVIMTQLGGSDTLKQFLLTSK